MKHAREYCWSVGDVAFVPGHVPGSFWRMPVDLESWTPDMEHGLIAREGRVEPVSADEHPNYVPGDGEARQTFWRAPGTVPEPRHAAPDLQSAAG